MENNKITISVEQQFGEVIDIILQHKSRASKAVNEELLQTAWHVGGYVSTKLKGEEWGRNVRSLYPTFSETLRHAFFQVGSIITTTGHQRIWAKQHL